MEEFSTKSTKCLENIYKESVMYKLIAAISILIRQFCIPNPFEALGDGVVVNIGETPILLPPGVLNWIAEPFMHAVTFAVVGLYYDRGSAPALGSFLYLLFYCIHTFLLWLMSLAEFATWVVLLIVVLYIVCHMGLTKLRSN